MHPHAAKNFNKCNAKFEMTSFIRPRDMAWAPKCRNESRDPDDAHLGDSRHDKTNTSRGQIVYEVWSLQL